MLYKVFKKIYVQGSRNRIRVLKELAFFTSFPYVFVYFFLFPLFIFLFWVTNTNQNAKRRSGGRVASRLTFIIFHWGIRRPPKNKAQKIADGTKNLGRRNWNNMEGPRLRILFAITRKTGRANKMPKTLNAKMGFWLRFAQLSPSTCIYLCHCVYMY